MAPATLSRVGTWVAWVSCCVVASASLRAQTPAPVFVGWPPGMPRPETLRDVVFPLAHPDFVHIGSESCAARCVIEFGVDGDLAGTWSRWLDAVRARGWRVASDHASAGMYWGEMFAPAGGDRFHVVIGPVQGGGRGQMRRMSAVRASATPSVGGACVPMAGDAAAPRGVVSWPFDLDRDGQLDAAIRPTGAGYWDLYVVRGACAYAVGDVDGELVRAVDEQVERDGWIRVEAEGWGRDAGLHRRTYVHRGGRYTLLAPDAGTP